MASKCINYKKWYIIVKALAIIVVLLHLGGFFLIYKKASSSFTVPFMTSYRGSACIVTGKVIFDGYKSGTIYILAKRTPRKELIPDIAMTILSSPGTYMIKVPTHIDKVSLIAVNSPEAYSGFAFSSKLPFGVCIKNPVRINGKRIIANADIPILKP